MLATSAAEGAGIAELRAEIARLATLPEEASADRAEGPDGRLRRRHRPGDIAVAMTAEAISIAATTKPRKSASAAWDYALYLAIVAVYTLPYLWSRDLLYRDETRYGAVVREMIRNDAWLTLTLNDRPYLEKPPLFFTLIRAVAEIAGSTEPWVFLAVVAASAFFFVAASHLFLRSIGADRSTARLANLFLLAMAWLPPFMNYLRMDLLFAGFILLSLAAYARGIERAEANLWPLAGGLMAAIAILVKGPFGGLMPLLTVIAYAVASGQGRRLLRIDLLASLAVAVLPVAAWFGLLYARFGREVIARIFGEQLVERAVAGRDAQRGWWLYLVWAPLSFMPWLLLLPALRLPQIRAALFGPRPIDWRRLPRTVLFTLSFLVPSFLLLNLVAQKNIQYLAPLLPGFAVLLALAYRRLEPAAPRLFDRLYLFLAGMRARDARLHPGGASPHAAIGVGDGHAFRRP